MKNLNFEQMEKLVGGKFWGTGQVELCTDDPLGGAWCSTCQQDYKFWIKWGDPYGCTDPVHTP